jgi:hypothetical protein
MLIIFIFAPFMHAQLQVDPMPMAESASLPGLEIYKMKGLHKWKRG